MAATKEFGATGDSTIIGPSILISGKLSGAAAFMFGRLKITGDIFFSQTMQDWFNRTT